MSNERAFLLDAQRSVSGAARAIKRYGTNGLSPDEENDVKELLILLHKLERAVEDLDEIADMKEAAISVSQTIEDFVDQFGDSLLSGDITRATSIKASLEQHEEQIIREASVSAANAVLYASQVLQYVAKLS